MLIKQGDIPLGRLTFQLYSNRAPRTCQNFLYLCRGDLPDGRVRAVLLTGGLALVLIGYGGGLLAQRALTGTSLLPLVDLEPHANTTPEMLGNLGMVALLLVVCLVVAERVPWLVAPAAATIASGIGYVAGSIALSAVVSAIAAPSGGSASGTTSIRTPSRSANPPLCITSSSQLTVPNCSTPIRNTGSSAARTGAAETHSSAKSTRTALRNDIMVLPSVLVRCPPGGSKRRGNQFFRGRRCTRHPARSP